MKRPKEITTKLKAADVELAEYTTQLEKENLKLQRRIAKLEAEKITSDNRIRALEKELKKSRPSTQVIIQTTPELKKLMTEN